MERVAGVIRSIEPNDSPERFRGLGVDVILGSGRFTGPQTFEVGGRRLTAKNFVIATGSRAAVPPIPGIERTPYLTNETVFALRENVPHLLVIGSGPIGSELAQAFRRLGSEVTVVDIAPAILPREDRDLAQVVHRTMAGEGIRYHLGVQIVSIEGRAGDVRMMITKDGMPSTLIGTHLLVAAGRKVNIEGLGLEAAGVRVEKGRIVHEDLVTSNPRIHVIGDAAGGHQFTHVAEHHAGIVLRRAVFRMKWAKPSTVVPWATYTDPELARVGVSETEAKQQGLAHRVYRFPLDDIDRARDGKRDRGAGEGRHCAERKAARCRDRRAACRRTDRRMRARAEQGNESRRSVVDDPRLSDVRDGDAPGGGPAVEGRPDAVVEVLDQAPVRAAGGVMTSGTSPKPRRSDPPLALRAAPRGEASALGLPGGARGSSWRSSSCSSSRSARSSRFGGQHYLSLETIKANRDALLAFAERNFIAALAIAFVVYAGATALSLPGGLVLSLAMGFIFGRWVGTVLVVVAATVGATLVFLAARYLFADWARKRLGGVGEKINAGFTENAFAYLLFLRLVPAFPFFLVNLAPAFTAIPLRTYVLATLIGIIPGTFVYVNLGQTLGRIESLKGLVSRETLLAFALLGLFALLPVAWKWFRSRRTGEARP